MKVLFLFLLSVIMPCGVSAQNTKGKDDDGKYVKDSVALDEVVVRTSRVKNKDNALRLFPTKEQKANSTNAYGLLARLALPNVSVNEVMRSISVPATLGKLQVRINDIIATTSDLIALDMDNVKYVDYIQNAGARYGDDVDFVINIVVERTQSGYYVGAEAMQSVTSMRNNEDMFAKFNKGRHELGLHYSFGYNRTKDLRYEETADYLMPDNCVTTVRRTDTGYRQSTISHDLQLQYSLVDSARYTLQTTLGGTLSRIPENSRIRTEQSGGVTETFPIGSTDNTSSAFLDVYFKYSLTKRQSITANLTGNYANSDYNYAYGGASPYSYNSTGNSHLLGGELIYENRLSPFTLSAGLKYFNEYSSTEYGGDVATDNSIRNDNIYGFAQIVGRVSKFSYMLGLGASRYYYRQASERYGYWLFRPQVQLAYSPWQPFRISYNFTMGQHPPRLAYLGDVIVRNNEMEVTVGNPSLRINKEIENELTMSLQYPSFYTQMMVYYRMMPHCSMARIDRVADADGTVTFISSRANQRKINMFFVSNYTSYDALPGKLSFNLQAGVYRFLNYGDDYKHHYTAFNWSAGAQAYLGKLSLTANVDNGWNFLEGESKSKSPFVYYLTASYKMGNFTLSMFWQHCFQDEVRLYNTEQLNRFVHKMQRMYSGEMGNMLTFRVTWRLSKGRKREEIRRNAIKTRNDTGIMKN